jgi:hypothetical protein
VCPQIQGFAACGRDDGWRRAHWEEASANAARRPQVTGGGWGAAGRNVTCERSLQPVGGAGEGGRRRASPEEGGGSCRWRQKQRRGAVERNHGHGREAQKAESRLRFLRLEGGWWMDKVDGGIRWAGLFLWAFST